MVRPISCSSKNGDKVSCNRLPVEEAGSQNLGKHHFRIINEVKDTGIKDMHNKIYHADFSESLQARKFNKILNLSDGLSWEDQKFLRLMEKEVAKEDGHYQLALPFRKRDQHWPNNRNRIQAKMRLQGLEKMFMKDETFFKITAISWKSCSKRDILKRHQMHQMVTNGISHIMACTTQLSQEK